MRPTPNPSAAAIQRAVDALDAYWRTHVAPPTLRELAVQMGLHAISNVAVALRIAAARGLVVTWGRRGPGLTYVPWWVDGALRTTLLAMTADTTYALRLVANYLADEARAAQAAGVDLPDDLIQAQQVVAAALGQEAHNG